MRLADGLRVLGIALFVLIFSGAHAAAHGTSGPSLTLQDDETFCERVQAAATPGDGTPEGLAAEDAVDIEAATPRTALIGVAGTPEGGTPVADVPDVFGDDGVLDAGDPGALCQDIDDDGVLEIGADIDGDGVLDPEEVLGRDVDQDERLTQEDLAGEDELGGPVTEGLFGEDNIFDEDDEGFLRENIDDDPAFEIGYDQDQSGTLDQDEVLGEDVDEDEALTEEEQDS